MTRWLATLCVMLLVAGCSGTPPATPAGSAPSGLVSPPVLETPSLLAEASVTTGARSMTPSPAPSPTPSPAPSPTPSPIPSTSEAASPLSATAVPHPDRWVKAGAFTTGRKDTQLALLGSGQVLAAGDEHTCGVESGPTDSAELWHPRRSRWTKTDRLPSARTMTTLVALTDGRALVTGGANCDYVAKSSTAVYDPETHRWSASGLLRTARMAFAAAPLAGGGVLVAGGLLITQRQEGRALRSVETWSPRTGRWSEVASLASVRMGAVAVTLEDGRVLVVGGFPSRGADRPLKTAELYDPATERWGDAGSLTAPRGAFTLVPLRGGGALVVGGQDDEDQAEVFDPATRTWSRVDGDAPTGKRPAAASLRDGRLLVVSGRTARIYDPRTGRWTPTARLPEGMWDASAVCLPDGSVLVGGGWTDPAPEGDTPGCPTYHSRTWRFVPGT